MNLKLISQKRAIATSLAVLAASGAAAAAATNTSTHYIKTSPHPVKSGHVVRVYGSVDHGCQTPGEATIYSHAFKGATKKDFAGVPAFFVHVNAQGKFSKRITIKRAIKTGSYHVGGRCGGGNFGSATLKVTHT